MSTPFDTALLIVGSVTVGFNFGFAYARANS